MLVSLIRILTPSILLRFVFLFLFLFLFVFVFLALGDADWRRPLRLTSLRDEWRRIGLPQPACCCAKNFRREAKDERRKAKSEKRQALAIAPRHQGAKFQIAEVSVAFTTMEALKLAARPKKHGWCTPIRRHSSRSDVSRLGCTIRASSQRQRNEIRLQTTAARPTSAHTAH